MSSVGDFRDYPAGTPATRTRITTYPIIDRVRWPAVWAGIFSAMSVLIILAVLGTAIGLSAYEPDRASPLIIGAGWWAALSALIAFLFGGWVAARTSAATGYSAGLLNGAMVWAVAVPLTLAILSGGVAAMMGDRRTDSGMPTVDRTTAFDDARPAAGQMRPDVAVATGTAARTAWGALISLLLGLGAASLGGLLGARGEQRIITDRPVVPPAV